MNSRNSGTYRKHKTGKKTFYIRCVEKYCDCDVSKMHCTYVRENNNYAENICTYAVLCYTITLFRFNDFKSNFSS